MIEVYFISIILGTILIWFSGKRLVQIVDFICEKTGIGRAFVGTLSSSFLGATLVAFATSLPELSTTLAAVHLGSYTLGISNIFGSNLLMVGLIFFADIFYRNGLLLDHVGRSTLFLGGLGVLVTAIYLWGLLERQNRTIFRMGIDSFLVLTVHITGLIILYNWL